MHKSESNIDWQCKAFDAAKKLRQFFSGYDANFAKEALRLLESGNGLVAEMDRNCMRIDPVSYLGKKRVGG